MAVAWNEIWATISLGNQRGSGVMVFDATSGAVKSIAVHTARGSCIWYASTASPIFASCAGVGGNGGTSGVTLNSSLTAGISAVPELNQLFTQCSMLDRRNLLGLTGATETLSVGSILADGACEFNAYWANSWMGTDAVWGMKWLLQMYKTNSPSNGDWVHEYRAGALGQATTRPVSRLLACRFASAAGRRGIP